jgi:primosomal protein N' (replication factor Y)
MERPVRIVSVLFPKPLAGAFDYLLPEGVETSPGAFVRAPLGGGESIGVVWEVSVATPQRKLKPIASLLETAPLLPEVTRRFIDRASRYVCAPSGALLAMAMRSPEALDPPLLSRRFVASGQLPQRLTPERERVLACAQHPLEAADLARRAGVSSGVVRSLLDAGALSVVQQAIDSPFERPDPDRAGQVLTRDQHAAAAHLSDLVRARRFATALLDGVTGSGKTEVYFEAIAAALRNDPTAQILVLLPEIALTQAVTTRFETRFGARPAEWHSAATASARRRAWREVASGRAQIVIGARSSLFLPFSNLRLIVVDEEHDPSYKQDEGVCYHARDLAVMRGHVGGCAVVLASATPSLESLANARQGRYAHVRLTARPGSARLPEIRLADMRARPPEKDKWLSPPLVDAIEETLRAGEQTLLYLNRRGYAPLVICKACGERLKAPNSDSWLTEHRHSGALICHLTGFTMRKPSRCPSCQAPGALVGVGPGVERLSEETRLRFPHARVEIFSSDTVGTPEVLRDLVRRMEDHEIDILIGTQIAAKGHNFPHLTLVGVIDADSGLKGGDLRAGERTFQLLSQVSGRAGRATKPGRAIIQTYAPDSPAIALLAAGDREAFMDLEMETRESMGFPPFGRLGAVIVAGSDADAARQAALLVGSKAPEADGVEVWGPAPAPIAVLRGRHRWRFLVRSDRHIDLSAYLSSWKARTRLPSSIRMSLDVEPYSFM